MEQFLVFSVLIAIVVLVPPCLANGKVTIHKFEDCEPNADYAIKIAFTIKNGANGMQTVEKGTLSSKIELGNNILDVAEIYAKDNGQYDHLITIKENVCDAVNKYMGEFMHEMQTKAGLQPGSCPVPAGDYEISDHDLDFEKFKFKKVPEGEFRVKATLLDAATNKTLNCHIIEFELSK